MNYAQDVNIGKGPRSFSVNLRYAILENNGRYTHGFLSGDFLTPLASVPSASQR